jgi:hypothetical protein
VVSIEEVLVPANAVTVEEEHGREVLLTSGAKVQQEYS